jgi:hypothetical protein
MKNCYHQRLNLPFELNFSPIATTQRLIHYDISGCADLIKWLADLNLEVVRAGAEQFYTEPNKEIQIHVDGGGQDSKVKLNFQFQGRDSIMKWYRLTTNCTPKSMPDIVSSYLHFDKTEVVEIFQSTIGFPSLINAGIPHNVINGPDPRYVISVPIWNLGTNTNLQWPDAVEKFAPWIEKSK